MILKFCKMRIQSDLIAHQESLMTDCVQFDYRHSWETNIHLLAMQTYIKFLLQEMVNLSRDRRNLPSSSGLASWYSARTLKTFWAFGVKLCKTIEAVFALWELPPWARTSGRNIPSTLYGAKVGTWCQYQLNCVWIIFLSHTCRRDCERQLLQILCQEMITYTKKLYLQRSAFTWSIEATIRTWEQAAIRARCCWVSGSRRPGPSMLWTITQTKFSLSSWWGPCKNARRSSMDWTLNGCWLFWDLPDVVFWCIFSWSHRSSAKVITTCKITFMLKIKKARTLQEWTSWIFYT